jgi:hypothetical protein
MAEDVVNDDASVGIVVDVDTIITCKRFPLTVNVANEVDKCCWAVGKAKGHHGICPFYCIRPLKSQFYLTGKGDSKLMIAGRGVIQPHAQCHAKLLRHRGIEARNQISDDLSNRVEWDMVDAKPPYKVLDVSHVLLMRLRCMDGLEEPPPICESGTALCMIGISFGL